MGLDGDDLWRWWVQRRLKDRERENERKKNSEKPCLRQKILGFFLQEADLLVSGRSLHLPSFPPSLSLALALKRERE